MLKYKFAAQRKGKRRVSELTTIYIYLMFTEKNENLCYFTSFSLVSNVIADNRNSSRLYMNQIFIISFDKIQCGLNGVTLCEI